MRKSKKDKKVVINASFEELVKLSVGDNPKPAKKEITPKQKANLTTLLIKMELAAKKK